MRDVPDSGLGHQQRPLQFRPPAYAVACGGERMRVMGQLAHEQQVSGWAAEGAHKQQQ
jgi:hypothetical protein